ncbi:MAG TPA: NAD(P)-dependent oxidoreductase [Micromonosporaceae bacterium]|nr:NAD(P)-dependent oxidoreductase [Micromonosporaceae bacterium]
MDDRASAGKRGHATSTWVRELQQAPRLCAAVVGGSGRLGSWLTRQLTSAGHRVRVVDAQPPSPLPGMRFVRCDLGGQGRLPAGLLAGCDVVFHLAALHGAHLVGGADRRRFWAVNVNGTQAVVEAALRDGVRRLVLAGSTSVYGAGSAAGPALVLDESSPLRPEDIYDLTKVAAEQLVQRAARAGLEGVTLRFGRFFFGSQAGYHLRKLSTGLDVTDACQALVRSALAPALARPAYCVASDLPLDRADRARLGEDATAVLQERFPRLVEAAQRLGLTLPDRVGKSVCSDALRQDLGYAPERTLEWVTDAWARHHARARSQPRRALQHEVSPLLAGVLSTVSPC